MKLKHWWWYFIKPKDYFIDETILSISASNKNNAKVSKKLAQEFLNKYYK